MSALIAVLELFVGPLSRSLCWPAMVCIVATAATGWGHRSATAQTAVSYTKDIEPLFTRHCVACHNAGDAQAGLNMETIALTQKGGRTGPAWPADSRGKAADSLMVKYLDGRIDPHMPKGKKRLSEKNVTLITRWIDEGAIDDSAPKPTRLLPRQTGPARPDSLGLPPVTALAWHPANHYIAVAGYGEIRLLSPADGSLVGHLFDVTQRVHALRFDAAGKILVAGGGVPGRLGEVTIYDVATAKAVGYLEDTKDCVYAIAVRPDGARIATGGPDKTLRLYDTATGQLLSKIEDHADWIMSLAYSADGQQLASCGRDKTVKIWDPDKGERTATAAVNHAVYAVDWLADGKHVVAACADKTARLISTADGKLLKGFAGAQGETLCLAVSPHGQMIATGSADKVVRICGPDGKSIRNLTGHNDWVYTLAFSPDGKFLASGSFDGQVLIWNLADGKIAARWPPAAAPASVVK